MQHAPPPDRQGRPGPRLCRKVFRNQRMVQLNGPLNGLADHYWLCFWSAVSVSQRTHAARPASRSPGPLRSSPADKRVQECTHTPVQICVAQCLTPGLRAASMLCLESSYNLNSYLICRVCYLGRAPADRPADQRAAVRPPPCRAAPAARQRPPHPAPPAGRL